MTRDQVLAIIEKVQIGYLATVDADNAPRVRPVFIKDVYDDELYFFTFSTTRKVAEIEANPQVEVVWADVENNSQARISGKAVMVEDEAMHKRFLNDNPNAARIIPERARHLFTLYKIQPERVEGAEGLVSYTGIEW